MLVVVLCPTIVPNPEWWDAGGTVGAVFVFFLSFPVRRQFPTCVTCRKCSQEKMPLGMGFLIVKKNHFICFDTVILISELSFLWLFECVFGVHIKIVDYLLYNNTQCVDGPYFLKILILNKLLVQICSYK